MRHIGKFSRLLLIVTCVLWVQACTADRQGGDATDAATQDGQTPVDGTTTTDGHTPDDASPEDRLVVQPGNRRWLFHNDGSPFYICGPGDPENFLYRGTRNGDGTRDGDQMELIAKLASTGANSIYFQAIRSNGGDGENDHNPFVDADPALGLDDAILDQWDTWFDAMDDAGIVQFFFFYDDSACIWDCNNEDEVPPEELVLINGLVDRFEHHRYLIWVVAEEYQEAFTTDRVSNIAAVIRATDDYEHPIAVHKLTGLTFDEFASDPNIDQFAIQHSMVNPDMLHAGMVQAFANAAGRYNLNMSEMAQHGTSGQARLLNWASALGGAYVMVILWNIADTHVDDLRDCGTLVEFMESTRFDTMEPRDDLAFGDTEYVLANPADTFILYASVRTGDMGVRAIDPGTYDLTWLDAVSGVTEEQIDISVNGGDVTWPTPPGLGAEVAVYIRRAGN